MVRILGDPSVATKAKQFKSVPKMTRASVSWPKGRGEPANDAPVRPIVTETRKAEPRNTRLHETRTPSGEFVNLGFIVPKEFRHRLRKIAAEKDVRLVEILREAVDLYEKAITA